MSEEKKREPMTSLQAHVKSFGDFNYNGKYYVMVSKPFTFAARGEKFHYSADAICPEDSVDDQGFRPMYHVKWEIIDEDLLALCQAIVDKDREKANAISLETGVTQDYVDCDFDKPYSLEGTGYKYNIETIRKRYEWD